MKNVQVIDGATNCTYSVFAVSEETFKAIFPEDGQDIEFVEDLIRREGENRAGELLTPVWKNRLEKKDIVGIHGTLFYELEMKKAFYPTKREADLDRLRAR